MEKGEPDPVTHICSRSPILSDGILINECVKNDFDIIGKPVHAKNETSSTPQTSAPLPVLVLRMLWNS